MFIIAEIGINHQGDIGMAKKMVRHAESVGVSAVKFQKRRWQDYPKTVRWSNTFQSNMSYQEHKRRLEFNEDEYYDLKRLCNRLVIDWGTSIYDLESLAIIQRLEPDYWKIASVVAATEPELAIEIAKQPGTCYLSLGMMDWTVCDYVVQQCSEVNENLILMHCVADYPCKDEDVNLSMIRTLQERYGLPVGYSGHDKGVPMSVAAVVLGAVAIEKHFTLDHTLPGSDHAASLEPHGLETLVRHVKAVEKGMGTGKRQITDGELVMLGKFRKG